MQECMFVMKQITHLCTHVPLNNKQIRAHFHNMHVHVWGCLYPHSWSRIAWVAVGSHIAQQSEHARALQSHSSSKCSTVIKDGYLSTKFAQAIRAFTVSCCRCDICSRQPLIFEDLLRLCCVSMINRLHLAFYTQAIQNKLLV